MRHQRALVPPLGIRNEQGDIGNPKAVKKYAMLRRSMRVTRQRGHQEQETNSFHRRPPLVPIQLIRSSGKGLLRKPTRRSVSSDFVCCGKNAFLWIQYSNGLRPDLLSLEDAGPDT